MTPEQKAELVAVRAQLSVLDAAIVRLIEAADAPQASAEPPSIYMRLPEYLRARNISRRTMDKLIAHGFPVKRYGPRMLRVIVADGDKWLEKHHG